MDQSLTVSVIHTDCVCYFSHFPTQITAVGHQRLLLPTHTVFLLKALISSPLCKSRVPILSFPGGNKIRDSTSANKVRSIKIWFSKVGMVEWTGLNLYGNESEHQFHSRSFFFCALVDGMYKSPQAVGQSLPRRVERSA